MKTFQVSFQRVAGTALAIGYFLFGAPLLSLFKTMSQKTGVVTFNSLFAILALCGCGAFHSHTGISVPTPMAQYRAYGASITYGMGVRDPSTQSFPALVAGFEHVSFANNAISGDQACDVMPRQVLPNQDSPDLTSHPTYSLLIGTNDADMRGFGAYEAVYRLCHQGIASWLAIPFEHKVLANGIGVTTTGPGELETSGPWAAWTTQGQGSSISFEITVNRESVIYAWPMIDDASPATYSYSLDGVTLGSAAARPTPSMSTAHGTTRLVAFQRLPPVRAGKHVVTFTQTNSGESGLSVIGVGVPRGPVEVRLPFVLVGTITYQYHGSSGDPCTSANETPCLEYNNDIQEEVSMFSADGLNVRVFDTRKYMFATAAEMSDSIHPNALGQLELSHSVEAVWPKSD